MILKTSKSRQNEEESVEILSTEKSSQQNLSFGGVESLPPFRQSLSLVSQPVEWRNTNFQRVFVSGENGEMLLEVSGISGKKFFCQEKKVQNQVCKSIGTSFSGRRKGGKIFGLPQLLSGISVKTYQIVFQLKKFNVDTAGR